MINFSTRNPMPQLKMSFQKNDSYLCPKGFTCIMIAGVLRYVSKNLSAAIFGIGVGLITTRLVMKIVKRYDSRAVVKIKEAIFHKDHLKVAVITFVALVAISMVSLPAGMGLGFLLGCYCGVTLEVERRLNRLRPLTKEGLESSS